jgi:hypothetical protein
MDLGLLGSGFSCQTPTLPLSSPSTTPISKDNSVLSDDDLRSILEPASRPVKVSMMDPLTVLLAPQELVRLLEDLLAHPASDAITRPRLTPADTPRCLDLLEWARGLSGSVSLSIYPSDEDGFEDLEALLNGESTMDDDALS